MRIVMVYRPKSEHRMAVETFLRDYKYQTGREIETIDPGTRDGADFCRVLDIVEYPTMVVVDAEGKAVQTWRGPMLPTISEVSFYN